MAFIYPFWLPPAWSVVNVSAATVLPSPISSQCPATQVSSTHQAHARKTTWCGFKVRLARFGASGCALGLLAVPWRSGRLRHRCCGWDWHCRSPQRPVQLPLALCWCSTRGTVRGRGVHGRQSRIDSRLRSSREPR